MSKVKPGRLAANLLPGVHYQVVSIDEAKAAQIEIGKRDVVPRRLCTQAADLADAPGPGQEAGAAPCESGRRGKLLKRGLRKRANVRVVGVERVHVVGCWDDNGAYPPGPQHPAEFNGGALGIRKMFEQPATEQAFEVIVGEGNGSGCAQPDRKPLRGEICDQVRRVIDGDDVAGVLAREPTAAGTDIGDRAFAPKTGFVPESSPNHLDLAHAAFAGGKDVPAVSGSGRRRMYGMAQSTDEFYRIQKLPPYVFAVINEMRAKARAEQQDVIDMGMGNPDGSTPRVVVSKMVEAVRNARNHRYSISRGIPKLREEIVRRYQTKYAVDLDPDTEAIVTIGAKDALAHLLFAVIGPGDGVVSPNPAYPIHQYGVIMAEGQACLLPMPSAAEFLNRLEDLYRTSTKPPKMLLISFPHNPTTTCVDLDFFRQIIALAARHGTLVVHDFAYADLGFDGYVPPSILQVDGAKEVAVEIFSMSKSYNMAGWRVGYCLGNRRMIGALARIKSYLDYGVFQPIQIASIIALRECEEETRKICAIYQKRRDVLVNGLNRAGWPVEKPQGTMFLWAPVPEPYRAAGSLEFAKLLMKEALVAVSPGIGFGPLGEGYVRFALIENEHRIKQAARSIGKFLKA